MKIKNTKRSLIISAFSLIICVAMLVGTTFAWFTDSITSGGNIIKSGNLDLKMYWTDDLNSGTWYDVEDPAYNTIFSYDNWEPGYTEVKYIKIKNEGNLALNYELCITPQNGVGKLAEVINVFYANDKNGVAVNGRDELKNLSCIGLLSNVLNGGATANGTLLPDGQTSPFHDSNETIVTLAMTMLTTAGNEYQDEEAGDFTITALATQAPFEEDNFGSDYDSAAEMPKLITSGTASAPVNPVNNKVPAGGVTLSGDGISATVPEGVLLEPGTNKLTLKITPLKNTTSDITVVNNEVLIPVDVHIDGIDPNNTTPIVIDLGAVLPKYLNMGNYYLFHVENGTPNAMTLVDSAADLTVHNSYAYNPDTGELTVAMATFSEVTVLYDKVNPWDGKYDYEFKGEGTEGNPYLITTADELAGLGQIVGGMGGQTETPYTNQYFKLVSNINLGYGVEDHTATIFTPIGYSYKDGISTVRSFEGTFDGNGHTISNFYQNTWEIDGDYDAGYYKDGMGLFGYVVNGTVKNLTVDNFSSDGEFTPTGVIAAYSENSTFENIAITNCNPRVYNTGNGGIVGIGGRADDFEDKKLTFKNITIDNTNKISALWGSWDVACGGLMGMFRGKGSVDMTNCHVAAQIDVYNDVCGNYQYYWYRYSGMLIGTNKNMTTDENGYTVPETDKFKAVNCTVHFGEWNNYYYCELVENTLASYTHDHQFSRLTEINNVSDIKDDDAWTTIGNFYTKTKDEEGNEIITCYHIRKDENGDLYQHKHEAAGTETVNNETVNKEDKTCVYLPFNQLFTGYGWGVKHIPVYNGENYAFDGVTILDRDEAYSVEKFAVKDDVIVSYKDGMTVSVGKMFSEVASPAVPVKDENVQVFVSPVGEGSTVSAEYIAGTNAWEEGTITFSGTGLANISITDYYFCKTTTFTVNVTEETAAEKYLNNYNNWNMIYYTNKSVEYEHEILAYDTDGDGIYAKEVDDAKNGTTEGKYFKEETDYGRTDNTSILVSANQKNTYVKLPNLKANTNYTLTFYYSGLETSSSSVSYLFNEYYLYAPSVSGGSLVKGANAGKIYGAVSTNTFYYSGTKLNIVDNIGTSNPVVGKNKWNKVEFTFNTEELGDIFLVFYQTAGTPNQAQRWIDDISLIEHDVSNSGLYWNMHKNNAIGPDSIDNTKGTITYNTSDFEYIYPGQEGSLYVNVTTDRYVATKFATEKNTNYKITFKYKSPDTPKTSAGESYYLESSFVLVEGNSHGEAISRISYNSVNSWTNGVDNKNDLDTLFDSSEANEWHDYELEFNSGENEALYFGMLLKTSPRDLYISDFQITKVES